MPTLSAAGKQALDDLITQTIADGALPGVVLAVASLDGTLYSSGGGRAVHGDPASPAVTPETLFWLCSMTKLPTAIAALQLIERGALALDTPVAQFFPQLGRAIVVENAYTDPSPAWKPAARAITVEHLLTHSSGLNSGHYSDAMTRPMHHQPDVYAHAYKRRETGYDEFFEVLKGPFPEVPLVFEPGAGFSYGCSTDVLGFVVEKVSGQTLEEYFQEHIFRPLGIASGSFELTAETAAALFPLHFRNPDGALVRWTDQRPLPQRYPNPVHAYFGGGGAYSTLPDFLALCEHILQIEAGRPAPGAILSQASARGLFAPRLGAAGAAMLTGMVRMLEPTSAQAPLNWSLGLAVNTGGWAGMRRAGAAWWSGWAGTYFVLDPAAGVALVLGTQVVPPMDGPTLAFAAQAERIVYANLVD